MSEDLAGGTEHDHSKQQGAGVERTAAARDVLAERRRQVEKEGWTPDHDDLHADGFIGVAGACYALSAASQLQRGSAYWSRRYADEFRELWPWDEEWRKPKDPRRDLVRAAALILAEIERIDRTTVPDSRDADSITRSSNEQSPDEARDAARYRWLRDQPATIFFDYGVTFTPVTPAAAEPIHVHMIGNTELDAAIDAAIAAAKEGGRE